MQKRFWGSVVVVWLVMVVTDGLFHGVWLAPLYKETAQFWRPDSEMKQWMPLMWIASFIFSWAFVWIYTNGISKTNPWGQAFRYGLAILLVAKVPELMGVWVTTPYPWELITKWFVVSFTQALLCAFAMTWSYKPWLNWQVSQTA